MIILFYGQPAAGKTTLADELYSRLSTAIYNLYSTLTNPIELTEFKFIRIDGDKWRDVTNNKDYSKEGRNLNLKGAFNMALYLENEGFIPILSFVTPYDELREYLKSNSKNLVQIYLEYEGDRGRNKNFAQDFEEPTDYNLKINTTYRTINDCVDEVVEYCGKNFK
tara:strand:+ start:767 stop:1264 length:498 start_codon:yes stop_codon:yes gene_type:complete